MEKRSEFYYQMMVKVHTDNECLNNICFTDECTLILHNEPNVQNWRASASENTRNILLTKTQYVRLTFGREFMVTILLDHLNKIKI